MTVQVCLKLSIKKNIHTRSWYCSVRRGIILYSMVLYLEYRYQSVCPFVELAPPGPFSRKRVCPPPRATITCGQGGGGEPIRTTGEKAWHSDTSPAKSMPDKKAKKLVAFARNKKTLDILLYLKQKQNKITKTVHCHRTS